MLPEKLQELLKLVGKTGDRLVVFDANSSDKSFVLMDLDNYQKIIKIDIQNTSKPLADNSLKEAENIPEIPPLPVVSKNLTEEDLTDKINREISMWKNGVDKPYAEDNDQPRKAWQIPNKVKDNAQEVAS